MVDITVTLTESENKALGYAAVSQQEWAENALTERARRAGDEIIAILLKHCNANDIAMATGREAQINQAFTLNLVESAADREANFVND
jgi:hypothetical protein